MTADQARDIMLAVFKAAWDLLGSPAGSFPAVYSDVPGNVPTTETVWARVTVRHAVSRARSLSGSVGTKRYENTGILWVQVFGPIGDGSIAVYAASQAVVNAYRDAKTSVLFRNVTLVEVGSSGAFERVDVKADFEYDEVR